MEDNNKNISIELSIVAPAYNESGNLRQFVNECVAAGDASGGQFEIIIANDCSDDGSSELLDELMGSFPQLRVLDMKKRSGQTAALDAALRGAKGKYIATLDADLQNDPADIPAMLKPIRENEFDYVNGWRNQRKDSGFRLIVSKYGNAFRNFVTRETIKDSGCGLKVFRRECIDRMKLFDGGHRFFVSLVRMDGWRVTQMKVNHRPRHAGVAKYGFFDRFFKVLRDAVAVRWMQNKVVVWKCVERGSPDDEKVEKNT